MKRVHKKLDPDTKALAAACRALSRSTSLRMLRANMAFLVDRYLVHPPADLVERLRERGGE